MQRQCAKRQPLFANYFAGRTHCGNRGKCATLPDMNKAEVAIQLSRIRNLRAFAADAKIPRRTLYNVMQGSHEPKPETLRTITAALRVLKPATR